MGHAASIWRRLQLVQEVAFNPREGKSNRVRYDRLRKEFTVKCIPPCPNVVHFQTAMLLPYVVTDEAVQSGYAGVEDCRRVAADTLARPQ